MSGRIMACSHPGISWTSAFGRRGGDGLAQVSGRCTACGAPVKFQPQPTLSLDSRDFQIPFTFGAPQQAAPAVPGEVLDLSNRRAVN